MSGTSSPTFSHLPTEFRIVIEGERAHRFFDALNAVVNANDSLMASAENFVDVDYAGRQIHPQLAVEGYTRLMQKRLEVMLAILDDEDLPAS